MNKNHPFFVSSLFSPGTGIQFLNLKKGKLKRGDHCRIMCSEGSGTHTSHHKQKYGKGEAHEEELPGAGGIESCGGPQASVPDVPQSTSLCSRFLSLAEQGKHFLLLLAIWLLPSDEESEGPLRDFRIILGLTSMSVGCQVSPKKSWKEKEIEVTFIIC